MQVSVVIHKLKEAGFSASTVSPPLLSATGPTRDIALATLRDQLAEKIVEQEFVSLEVPARGGEEPKSEAEPVGEVKSNPWAQFAGAFKDDPDYAEVIEHMKEYRAQRNRELDALVD